MFGLLRTNKTDRNGRGCDAATEGEEEGPKRAMIVRTKAAASRKRVVAHDCTCWQSPQG